jgi:hypothetical protein
MILHLCKCVPSQKRKREEGTAIAIISDRITAGTFLPLFSSLSYKLFFDLFD